MKNVPDPVAKVNGLRGGKIRKGMLVAAGQVDVELENFDFDMKFAVESFSVIRLSTVLCRKKTTPESKIRRCPVASDQ